MKDKAPVECLVHQPDFTGIMSCRICSSVPEYFGKLTHEHGVCVRCCKSIASRARNSDGSGERHLEVRERRYNTSLDGVYLKCPYCDTAKAYGAMKEHLEEVHATLLENRERERQSKNVEDEDGTPLASTGTCGDREAEKSASAPESLPCLFCGKSWDRREIQDHMTACLEDVTECPECVEEVKRKDYEEHIMQCSKTEAEKKAVDAPTNSQNVDDDSETRQKVEEIETLKQAIQMLEERIQSLEKPLMRVIRKLREEADRRKK